MNKDEWRGGQLFMNLGEIVRQQVTDDNRPRLRCSECSWLSEESSRKSCQKEC